MPQNIVPSPESWRNYNATVPIVACLLGKDDLKNLYKIIDEKQREYRDGILNTLYQMENEAQEAFEKRKSDVCSAFVTSVTITGTNDEIVTGNSEKFFDSASVPTFIRSVFYSTQAVPSVVLNHVPLDRITVMLDFSRPPLLDFGRLPTLPTPNDSNYQISANNESWFAATKKKLDAFFYERRTGFNWLHRSAVYDVLLLFLGLPGAIWTSCRLESYFSGISKLPIFLSSIVYVYVFVLSLTCFRILFSYSRWVFPKMEIESAVRASPLRHRSMWGILLVGVLGTILYDVIKALMPIVALTVIKP